MRNDAMPNQLSIPDKPELLKPRAIEEINKILLNKTGCFAFWEPAVQWQYAEPASNHEAVELWSIALYTIYHDLGSFFLKNILDPWSPRPWVSDALKSEIRKCRNHMKRIDDLFRPCVAHGNIGHYVPDRVMGEVARQLYIGKDPMVSSAEYFAELTEQDWRKWANRLRKDANQVYYTLSDWAEACAGRDNSTREWFSNVIEKAVHPALLFNDLDRDYRSDNNGDRAEVILGAFAKDQIKSIAQEVKTKYFNETLKSPGEIIAYLGNELSKIHSSENISSVSVAQNTGFSLEALR